MRGDGRTTERLAHRRMHGAIPRHRAVAHGASQGGAGWGRVAPLVIEPRRHPEPTGRGAREPAVRGVRVGRLGRVSGPAPSKITGTCDGRVRGPDTRGADLLVPPTLAAAEARASCMCWSTGMLRRKLSSASEFSRAESSLPVIARCSACHAASHPTLLIPTPPPRSASDNP